MYIASKLISLKARVTCGGCQVHNISLFIFAFHQQLGPKKTPKKTSNQEGTSHSRYTSPLTPLVFTGPIWTKRRKKGGPVKGSPWPLHNTKNIQPLSKGHKQFLPHCFRKSALFALGAHRYHTEKLSKLKRGLCGLIEVNSDAERST